MSSRKCSYEINTESEILKPIIVSNYRRYVDYGRFDDDKLRDTILDFVITMEGKLTREELANFFNNINTTTIAKKFWYMFSKDNGFFEADHKTGKNNRIVVRDYPFLYHELFHLASFSFHDGVAFNGFAQEYEKDGVCYTIGDGLNEGYTELLARRYFKGKYKSSAYNYQVKVVEKLEKIIGRERMEELYFTTGLYGLVEELKKYTSEEVIRDFILFNDFFLYQSNARMGKAQKREAVKESIRETNNFLAGVFLVKELDRKDNKEIDEQEFIEELRSFIEMFKIENEDGSFSYPSDSDDFNELLDTLDMIPKTEVYKKTLSMDNV